MVTILFCCKVSRNDSKLVINLDFSHLTPLFSFEWISGMILDFFIKSITIYHDHQKYGKDVRHYIFQAYEIRNCFKHVYSFLNYLNECNGRVLFINLEFYFNKSLFSAFIIFFSYPRKTGIPAVNRRYRGIIVSNENTCWKTRETCYF